MWGSNAGMALSSLHELQPVEGSTGESWIYLVSTWKIYLIQVDRVKTVQSRKMHMSMHGYQSQITVNDFGATLGSILFLASSTQFNTGRI